MEEKAQTTKAAATEATPSSHTVSSQSKLSMEKSSETILGTTSTDGASSIRPATTTPSTNIRNSHTTRTQEEQESKLNDETISSYIHDMKTLSLSSPEKSKSTVQVVIDSIEK